MARRAAPHGLVLLVLVLTASTSHAQQQKGTSWPTLSDLTSSIPSLFTSTAAGASPGSSATATSSTSSDGKTKESSATSAPAGAAAPTDSTIGNNPVAGSDAASAQVPIRRPTVPKTTANITGCWVVASVYPDRTCQYINNTCEPSPSIATSENCFICNRGYSVFKSEDDCMGTAGLTIASAGIDPYAYPSPYVSPPSCYYDRNRATDAFSPCPHLLPGVRLWEDATTWGYAGVPKEWDYVSLPDNTRIMITGCSIPDSQQPFKSIYIPPTSELILDDSPIHLKVGTIWVDGRLRAGAGSCRIGAPITITFARGGNVSELGIQVRNKGQLDLHGASFGGPTWTRLSSSIVAGQNWAGTQEWVGWRPGQLVLVTTSTWKDEAENQNEVLTIKSVASDGRSMVFYETFQFPHYGGPEYQSEIALLSRSILLQASQDAEYDTLGMQVKMEGPGPRARLAGVMVYRGGQLNQLGSYPIHYHMQGWLNDAFVTDCTVYRSFYRAFVVHATSNLLLKSNVAFHVNGHAFYLEEGVEEHNWLEANLAAYVHVLGVPAAGGGQEGQFSKSTPDRIEPTDATASGFYIPNPNNALKNNAASGGWSGFNYPRLEKPVGMSRWQTGIIPHQRPLKLFDGNTAHSSGYFYQRAGAIYFGGRLWNEDSDGGKLYYWSGRYELDARDDQGQPVFHVLTNCKVWLAQFGIVHWGQRVKLVNWQAYDSVRGATLFGVAFMTNAIINVRSGNTASGFPGNLWDLLPIAGFQWYDTKVMTIITNTTFYNYQYQSWLGDSRQAVWFSMVASDDFKPAGISATKNIKYVNCQTEAIVNNPTQPTGSSRYFNWLDTDGTSTMRGRASLVFSYPNWWQLSSECTFQTSWNAWMCDKQPWRELARLDVSVPGYTQRSGIGAALPPSPSIDMGYVAQFGYRGNDARKVSITRNEGVSGLTGTTGWYFHMWNGATPQLDIYVTQIPPGQSVLFATRYPSWAQFSIQKIFKWYSWKTQTLKQVATLQEVVDGAGDRYYFSGKHLYMKLTDEGDASLDKDFIQDGVTIHGTRYFSLTYQVKTTNLNCGWKEGAPFCWMADAWDDVPTFSPAYRSYDPAIIGCQDAQPPSAAPCWQLARDGQCGAKIMSSKDPNVVASGGYCAYSCGRCPSSTATPAACVDVAPPGGYTCQQQSQWGKCTEQWMKDGNYCAQTCGFCTTQNAFITKVATVTTTCRDLTPPGGYSCTQQKLWGACSQPWMKSGGYCAQTCGFCSTASNCVDVQPPGGATCAQQKQWGKCSEPWMSANNYCAATCGFCFGASEVSADGFGAAEAGGVLPPCAPCTDEVPPGKMTCAQYKDLKKCGDDWLIAGDYCAATCGRCATIEACDDLPPPFEACDSVAAGGKCKDPMVTQAGWCRRTCGVCKPTDAAAIAAAAVAKNATACDPSRPCTDLQPPGSLSCQDHFDMGDCAAVWMRNGGFCAQTCGRCTLPTVPLAL